MSVEAQQIAEDLTGQVASTAGRPVSARTRVSPALCGRVLLAASDVWMVAAAILLASAVVDALNPILQIFGVLASALLLFPRLRSQRLLLSALDEAGEIFKRISIAYALASGAAVLFQMGGQRALLVAAVIAGPLVLTGRTVDYAVRARLRRRARARTLIVGGGEIARSLVSILGSHREYGIEVVGVVDDDPMFNSSEIGVSVLGSTVDLPHLVTALDIERVIVAFGSGSEEKLVEVVREIRQHGTDVWVIPRLFEVGSAPAGDSLREFPVMKLPEPPGARPEWVAKRVLDFLIAGVGLVMAAPVMALIALLVYIESGRPILYKQERVGQGGRLFNILKFRTMATAGRLRESTEWSTDQARVTRVGGVLRRTGLDELPQLWNVLRGEMSLIGPRPERTHFVDLFNHEYPRYDNRHRVPGGLSGWAQVHGLRGDTSIEERLAFDTYYIENWSLSRDIKIILRTAGKLIAKKLQGT